MRELDRASSPTRSHDHIDLQRVARPHSIGAEKLVAIKSVTAGPNGPRVGPPPRSAALLAVAIHDLGLLSDGRSNKDLEARPSTDLCAEQEVIGGPFAVLDGSRSRG